MAADPAPWPALWPVLHGASTHFPVAMTLAAALFDGLAHLAPGSSPRRQGLLGAGYWCILLGALGAFPAVLSGLLMARGEVLGHGALLYHHLFVWPAFAFVVGLGVWRGVVRDRFSRRGFLVYLIVLFITVGLMGGAGYWGGELILNP